MDEILVRELGSEAVSMGRRPDFLTAVLMTAIAGRTEALRRADSVEAIILCVFGMAAVVVSCWAWVK